MSEENFKQVKHYLKYGPLGSEFLQFQYLNFNNGKITSCCIDNVTARIVVNVINDLEFRMIHTSTSYPLVITQFGSTSPIIVSCLINKSLPYDKFVATVVQQNELDPKLWRYLTSKEVNNEKKIMKFCIDPKTSDDFARKRGILKFNKEELKVNEELNLFKRDMEIIKTMVKNDSVTVEQQVLQLQDQIISGTGHFDHRNDDWTWNGFQHEILCGMKFNCKNIKHLVLIGAGTGSFFVSNSFSFKLYILDTTNITFHWYVGIMSGKINYSKDQLGHLKELTIHKLPFDFDGGKVLKYIIEEMNLDKFYYGKIPLILNGRRQDVKEFEANEIQITSTYEMLRQFPSKYYLRLRFMERLKFG